MAAKKLIQGMWDSKPARERKDSRSKKPFSFFKGQHKDARVYACGGWVVGLGSHQEELVLCLQ